MTIFFVPDEMTVARLAVGDLALDCFGVWAIVDSITYRGTDVHGRAFVGFRTRSGPGPCLICSHTYKVGELVRTLELTQDFSSAELDQVERGTTGLYKGRTDCILMRTKGGGWLLSTEVERRGKTDDGG